MPNDPEWITIAILIPAVLAGGFGIAVRKWLKREVGWAVGVSIAFAASYIIAIHKPNIPPDRAEDWLAVFVAPAVAIMAVLASVFRSRMVSVIPWLARLVITALIPWLMLKSRMDENILFDQAWSATRTIVWIVGFVAIVLIGDLSLRAIINQSVKRNAAPGPILWPWLMMGLVCGAAGLTNIHSYNLTSGQHGLVLSGITLGAAIIAFVAGFKIKSGDHSDGPLVVEAAWFILSGILLFGFVYNAKMQWHNIAILAAAPHAAWMGEIPALRRLKAWQNAAARIVVVSVTLATAVVPTGIDYVAALQADANQPQDDQNDDIYHYYE